MANDSLCRIPGCGKRAKSRSLCSMHAERLRRHGDVHKGAHKPRGQCSVGECERSHYGHGYCLAHYKRWKKYGDPLAGGIKHGEAQVWLRKVAVRYAGDDCLTWPFGRNGGGYGRVSFRGNPSNAHAVILELAVGPKPTEKHECCHSCGNGHLGCVNPRHMYWGTRKENVADAIRHGTFSPPPH